jgi:hypothetical protein
MYDRLCPDPDPIELQEIYSYFGGYRYSGINRGEKGLEGHNREGL